MKGGHENAGGSQKDHPLTKTQGGTPTRRFWVCPSVEAPMTWVEALDSGHAASLHFQLQRTPHLGDEVVVVLELEPFRVEIDRERMAELVRDQLDEWPAWIEDATDGPKLDEVLRLLYAQQVGKIESLEEHLNELLGFGEDGPGRPVKWETWRVANLDPLQLARED